MTSSSSAFILVSNNNINSHSTASLPSPPLSHHYHHSVHHNNDKKMPTFMVDRAPLPYIGCGGDRSGLLSDTRYTSNNNRRRDVAELRPFLFNPVSDNNNKYYLPPIQNVMMTTPTASPSPPFDSYYGISSSSPISSIASSPTPVDEEDVDDELDQQKQHQQLINVRRKGSIASLLNSDPELRQLDEEESKCNYQSHFMDNYQQQQHSLKRGRPRQDHIEIIYNHQQQYVTSPIIKKQRTVKVNSNLDCVQQQACQSSSHIANTIANDSPRATKGLRHFSKQVCDKVAEKGVTTYNEVADELALDIQNTVGNEKHTYDQKNIRRRVYDALNVLMAMNIIAKDKKVIKWLGIPECYKQQMSNNNQDEKDPLDAVVVEDDQENDVSRQLLLKQIEQEELRQNELINSLNVLREGVNSKLSKHLQIRNLVWRNQQKKEQDNNSSSKISLPFFIVARPTTEDKHIDIANNSQSAVISFHHEKQHLQRFVYEDSEVLRHLQLNNEDPSATRS